MGCCSAQLLCRVVTRLVPEHLAAPPPHKGYTTSLRNVRRGGMAARVAAYRYTLTTRSTRTPLRLSPPCLLTPPQLLSPLEPPLP